MSIKANKQTYQVFRTQTLEGIQPYKNIKNCTLMMKNFCSFWRKMVLKNLFALLGYLQLLYAPLQKSGKKVANHWKTQWGHLNLKKIFSKGTKHIYHSTFTRLPNKSINKFLPWSILIKNSTSWIWHKWLQWQGDQVDDMFS